MQFNGNPFFDICVTDSIAAGTTVDQVVTRVAEERIVTSRAVEFVITHTAMDDVGASVAGQVVIEIGASQILDTNEGIRACTSGIRSARAQVDGDAAGVIIIRVIILHIAVRGGIAAGTTVQRIIAGAAYENVVTTEAQQCVVTGTTG